MYMYVEMQYVNVERFTLNKTHKNIIINTLRSEKVAHNQNSMHSVPKRGHTEHAHHFHI